MIRGAIDFIDGDRVSGWVHSNEINLKGRALLAFYERTCVGAGVVGTFRQDLADAGIGDGHVGFNFTISPPDRDRVNNVEVRFEGSDLKLLPLGGKATAPSAPVDAGTAPRLSPERIQWMHERGWLNQMELDFLRQSSSLGHYERSLRRDRGVIADAAEEADALLSLVAQEPIQLVTRAVPLADLAEAKEALLKEALHPVVALHAPGGGLHVVEGSHLHGGEGAADPTQIGVRVSLSANSLLLFDLRADFAAVPGDETATLYMATR